MSLLPMLACRRVCREPMHRRRWRTTSPSARMFVIGLIGFMTRRNLIIMFLCTELMFQGVGINLIAFGRFHRNLAGRRS